MKLTLWSGIALSGAFLLSLTTPIVGQASANNMQFSGTLVSDPCELDPQTSDLTVDFKSVIEKSLYSETRSAGVPFTINLKGCDTALGNQVTFTFAGNESPEQPGLLAVTGQATGIAIGLENADGTALALNQPSPSLVLSDGSSTFTFIAYVAAAPEAIQQQSITPGDFSATATFEMAYP